METSASNVPSQVVVPITVAQAPSNYGEQRHTEVHTPHHAMKKGMIMFKWMNKCNLNRK